MDLLKLVLKTVNKYFQGLEKRCQSLVTVKVTHKKRKINCSLTSFHITKNWGSGVEMVKIEK